MKKILTALNIVVKNRAYWIGLLVFVLAGLALLAYFRGQPPSLDSAQKLPQKPRIHPDYEGLSIPPNISPLNFKIEEQGSRFYAKISDRHGTVMQIVQDKPEMHLSIKSWRELLLKNQGGELYYDIAVKKNQQWYSYQRFTNYVVKEEIDNYLIYRKIHPSHNTWSQMGIYQREISSFREYPIIENQNFNRGCCHCHSICREQPGVASIDIRSEKFGNSLLILKPNEPMNLSGTVGFTAWHPRGHILACSFNKPRFLVHGAKNDMRDIVDLSGWIGTYSVDSNIVKRIPGLSDENLIFTFPTWSPAGRYLYCCGAPNPWKNTNATVDRVFDKIKYGLYRISYNPDKDTWGPLESVISAADTGLSISQPQITPDGRWLTFSMSEYGCWPVYRPDSDLFMVDLESAERSGKISLRKLEINSAECESWHSWSSNSRWLVFSSKRDNPLFSRPHLSYLDKNGVFSKPFRLPQEDPTFYDSYLKTYTIPTLSPSPIKVPEKQIAAILKSRSSKVMPIPHSREITGPAAQYPQSQ